nr:DNA helicase [Tanacetum cinerariifolium]
MVTDLEDLKTHTVGGVWSGGYIDNGFTKSMSELDRCYTMLQELHYVIVDKVCREKVFEVNEALDTENSRASSFQVRGIHVDETKVNKVQDLSSPKALLEVRNNKFPNVSQEEDELEYVELLDGEAKQVTYVVQRTLCSPTKLESKILATLVASPKYFQAERKETRVFYAFVVKRVKDVMENAIPAVIKPLLAEFGKIVKDDTPDALPPLRNIQHQINLSRKTTLLVSISNEVFGFDSIKGLLYANDEDYGNIWMGLETNQHQGLSAHLGRDKTIARVESQLYCLQLKSDVGAFMKRCVACQERKDDFGCSTYYEVVLPRGGLFARSSNVHYFGSRYTAHPQTDCQTEVVNHILGNMIRCLCGKKPKLLDVSLAQAKFANSAVYNSMGFSSFEVVYKTSLMHVVELVDLSRKKSIEVNRMVEDVQATHEVVRANITEANDKYKFAANKHRWKKLFQVGNEVMVFLRKEHFSVGTYSKLEPKKYGPYKILRKINDNAYVVDLLNTMSILKTFNVSDIYEFHSEDVNKGGSGPGCDVPSAGASLASCYSRTTGIYLDVFRNCSEFCGIKSQGECIRAFRVINHAEESQLYLDVYRKYSRVSGKVSCMQQDTGVTGSSPFIGGVRDSLDKRKLQPSGHSDTFRAYLALCLSGVGSRRSRSLSQITPVLKSNLIHADFSSLCGSSASLPGRSSHANTNAVILKIVLLFLGVVEIHEKILNSCLQQGPHIHIVIWETVIVDVVIVGLLFGERPRFLQLYIYDTNNEVQNRMDHFGGIDNSQLEPRIVEGERDGYEVRGRTILPMSFIGGPRYMYAHYLDALVICQKLGNPQFFITFTCNVSWPEIKIFMSEYPHLTAFDRADVVCRLFEQKIQALIAFLKEEHIFGDVTGDSASKIRIAKDVDRFISAELPDPIIDPEGYNIVSELMMHGPCEAASFKASCMKDDKCSKKFPKKFNQKTFLMKMVMCIIEEETQEELVATKKQQIIYWTSRGYILYEIKIILSNSGKSLYAFGLPLPPQDVLAQLANRLLVEERNYNQEELAQLNDESVPLLNAKQRQMYDLIMNADTNSRHELIFVYGHGGTGKTFLWKTIINSLRSEGKNVLAVTSLAQMRLIRPDISIEEWSLVNSFASWLLDVGDGKIGEPAEEDPENTLWVHVPPAYCLPPDEQDIINSKFLDMVVGESTIYMSQDEATPTGNDGAEIEMLYPIENLNTFKLPGFPPHQLELKVGAPVMLLRNVNIDGGL